jgi:hypothetical protein
MTWTFIIHVNIYHPYFSGLYHLVLGPPFVLGMSFIHSFIHSFMGFCSLSSTNWTLSSIHPSIHEFWIIYVIKDSIKIKHWNFLMETRFQTYPKRWMFVHSKFIQYYQYHNTLVAALTLIILYVKLLKISQNFKNIYMKENENIFLIIMNILIFKMEC